VDAAVVVNRQTGHQVSAGRPVDTVWG